MQRERLDATFAALAEPAAPLRDAHREGWTSALDCLAEVIADLRGAQTD